MELTEKNETLPDDLTAEESELINRLEDENAKLKCDLAQISSNFTGSIPGIAAFRIAGGGDPIRVWREFRLLSVAELSSIAGISEADIIKAETGAPMHPRAYGRIAEGLNVKVSDLIPPLRDEN